MKTAMQRVFWTRVIKSTNGCWEWSGPRDSRGYGHLRWNGRAARAHRVAYELTKGQIPKGEGHHGICVMHICDNKVCCNPSHLALGSHNDNMADMRQKGRRKGIGTGDKNGRARLTSEQVTEIRDAPEGKIRLARRYGVSPAQIQRIRAGKQWVTA